MFDGSARAPHAVSPFVSRAIVHQLGHFRRRLDCRTAARGVSAAIEVAGRDHGRVQRNSGNKTRRRRSEPFETLLSELQAHRPVKILTLTDLLWGEELGN